LKSFSCLVLFLAFTLGAGAQNPSATLVGRVTDPTGAVVPGAAVQATNVHTNVSQQVFSNEVGDFTIPYLNPGRYALEARRDGFRTYRRSAFMVEVDQILPKSRWTAAISRTWHISPAESSPREMGAMVPLPSTEDVRITSGFTWTVSTIRSGATPGRSSTRRWKASRSSS
jgi:hypothetical protein